MREKMHIGSFDSTHWYYIPTYHISWVTEPKNPRAVFEVVEAEWQNQHSPLKNNQGKEYSSAPCLSQIDEWRLLIFKISEAEPKKLVCPTIQSQSNYFWNFGPTLIFNKLPFMNSPENECDPPKLHCKCAELLQSRTTDTKAKSLILCGLHSNPNAN